MDPAAKQDPLKQDAIVHVPKEEKKEAIKLSQYTQALIDSLRSIVPRQKPDDLSKINVSQTVSFLAILYEKVRNAIEYREENLVRRAAIERITRRRLSMNPEAKGEGENILRELLWARYFPAGSLGEKDITTVQRIISTYLQLKTKLLTGRDSNTKHYLFQFLIDLMTCEIEEALSPESANQESSFNYFMYQTIRKKVVIHGVSDQLKDAYFLAALERGFRKSDQSYARYHIFVTFYKPLNNYTDEELTAITGKLPHIFKRVDDIANNPYVENLSRFIRRQQPPFLILFDILGKKLSEAQALVSDKKNLWTEVEMTCRQKYELGRSRLHILAFKSLVYIFVTKMIFALILEYPISLWLYNEVSYFSIGVNSLFPPILMLIIVMFFRLPDDENTQRIYQRIIDIVDADKTFETSKAFMINKKPKAKRPILIFGFTVFYTMTFIITFLLINLILRLMHFNLVSQVIFVFFVTVITFFSYRIKQVVREYKLDEKQGILAPIGDFFFMPVVSVGKFFSGTLSKINFFTVIFDFIIEAPFKLIIEVIEEWITFTRAKKEEIV